MASAEKEGKNIPEIINLTNINDFKNVENTLLEAKCKVDETDENGMTALQHAAYKGQTDMCRLLLSYGADINIDDHDHNYSTLHFGALSGSLETVQLLLTSGAKTYHQNSLGRTAAQMAGFVGNHAVVSLINNYLPEKDVEYYSIPQGLETESKIPKSVVKPLYSLLMKSNLHPVSIALNMSKSGDLLENSEKIYRVLNLLCEKEAKRAENVNEVLCLKFYHLGSVIKTLNSELKSQKECSIGKEGTIVFETIIKKWLKARPSDGCEEYLEYYVRDNMKSFPYPEMPLFQQLVRSITSEFSGGFASLSILHNLINGQRGFQDDVNCTTCGLENKEAKKCARCKKVQYCDRLCQKLHWSTHKKFCEKTEDSQN